MNSRNRMTGRQVYQRIVLLLGVAAALPLLPTGMFAGFALTVLVGVWLFRAGAVVNKGFLWAILAIVALENLVFIIGFLR